DFRDLALSGEEARPIPLLAVVRLLGQESSEEAPVDLAAAYVRRLYAIFGLHCREGDLAPPRRHALEALLGLDRVPLWPLPTRPGEAAERLSPLLLPSVARRYPTPLLGG